MRMMTKVLVTDDDMVQRLIVRKSLEEEGYQVIEAEDGAKALSILSEEPDIRLLLTDLAMPNMDGYELIRVARKKELRYIYIIVLTSMDNRQSLVRALSDGADDYLIKPVYPPELKLRLRGGQRLLKLESQEELIFSMAKLSEYRSEETGYHLERVYHYTRLLARDVCKRHPEFGISLGLADEIARVSPLHDLGKVAIPDNILHKPGKLTAEEFEIMKTHTTIGANLIKEIYDKTGSTYLWLAYEIAMNHHERWNGLGYPGALKAEQIPISALIMSIADVYDALTSHRSYKKAFSHDTAKKMILEEKGKHFCPSVVDAFLRQEDAWVAVKERFKD